MARKIIFQLSKDGGLTTSVQGGQGKGCEELTKAFDGLGASPNRELLPEYHVPEEGERVLEGH